MQDQIMGAFLQKFMGSPASSTIVNVGAGSPADESIFAQDDALEREIEARLAGAGAATYEPEIPWGFSARDEDFGDISAPGMAAGNIVTDLLNRGRRATAGVVRNLGGATQDALKKVSAEIGSVRAVAVQARGMAQRNYRRLAVIEREWTARFGEKSRLQRVALQTLVSLPGIRSLNMLTTAQHIGVIDALSRLGEVVTDEYNGDVADVALTIVPEVPATDIYTTAGMDAVRDALAARDTELAARLGKVEQRLDAVLGALDKGELAKHAPAYKALLNKDIFAQIAVIAPSQLADRDEALYEGISKYILGQPKPAGAGILSGIVT